MAKGRKSKPANLAKVRGDTRKRGRRSKSAEPEFETNIPTAPEYLTGKALEEWIELTHELAAKQIITQVDQHMVAVYCQAVGRLFEVTDLLKTEGMTVESTRGIMQINPLVREESRLRAEIAKYASELGITPTARNKIRMVGSGKQQPTREQSLAEKFFQAKVKA